MNQVFSLWLQRNKGIGLLLLLLVVLRIPHFNRPLSKHHDFNNAVILINAVSWQQAGGGSQFWFTPLMNFQGASNKLLEKGPHTDPQQNHVYLSFGTGWYVLPYFIFTAFHILPTPAALEVLNILIGLITTILLYVLLYQWLSSKKNALLFAAFYVLMPAPLWYMGHSYVTTGIMLPLVLFFLSLWQRAAKHRDLQKAEFVQLFICIVLLMNIDWIAAFLAAGMGIWAIAHRKKITAAWYIFVANASAAICAIILIFWQFSQYLSWQQVLEYWQQRSAYRTLANQDESWPMMIFHALTHVGSGYVTLIIVIAVILFRHQKNTWIKPNNSWISWAVISVVLYNFTLFHWSTSHEFAWMALALLSVIWLAIHHGDSIATLPRKKHFLIITTGVLIYFVLNLPGNKSITGTQYNLYRKQAVTIQSKIPASAIVFTNVQNLKIVEWYTKRTFNYAVSKKEALKMLANQNIQPVFWLQFEQQELTAIELLQ